MSSNRQAALLPVILLASACGGGGESDFAVAGEQDAVDSRTLSAAVEPASIPADRAGAFELDGTVYTFLVMRCDLSGQDPAGMLLRGTGSAPDGRRISVEVERLAGGETVNERATVFFGGIVDGDHWTARSIGWPDGRWFADEAGGEPVGGPLIEVSEGELRAEGTYRNERDDSEKVGSIHAVCPA
jgi:hypothetical protein